MKILKPIIQLLCQHEWTKCQNYVDIWFDECRKCGKKRDTNIENIAYTEIKFPIIEINKHNEV